MYLPAIQTRYRPATELHSGYLVASDGCGSVIDVPYNPQFDVAANHQAAALALCARQCWHGQLYGARTSKGYVFVRVVNGQKPLIAAGSDPR